MVATAEESKWKRLEEKEDEFNNMFVNRNRAYSKGDSYENTGIFVTAAILENVKEGKNELLKNFEKLWSSEVYQNYSDQDFKSKMCINHDIFNYIQDAIHDQIV